MFRRVVNRMSKPGIRLAAIYFRRKEFAHFRNLEGRELHP